MADPQYSSFFIERDAYTELYGRSGSTAGAKKKNKDPTYFDYGVAPPEMPAYYSESKQRFNRCHPSTVNRCMQQGRSPPECHTLPPNNTNKQHVPGTNKSLAVVEPPQPKPRPTNAKGQLEIAVYKIRTTGQGFVKVINNTPFKLKFPVVVRTPYSSSGNSRSRRGSSTSAGLNVVVGLLVVCAERKQTLEVPGGGSVGIAGKTVDAALVQKGIVWTWQAHKIQAYHQDCKGRFEIVPDNVYIATSPALLNPKPPVLPPNLSIPKVNPSKSKSASKSKKSTSKTAAPPPQATTNKSKKKTAPPGKKAAGGGAGTKPPQGSRGVPNNKQKTSKTKG